VGWEHLAESLVDDHSLVKSGSKSIGGIWGSVEHNLTVKVVEVDVSGVNSRLSFDVSHLLINIEDILDKGFGSTLKEMPEFLILRNFCFILNRLEMTNWFLLDDFEATEFLNW
jgi:hypothetical protein